MSIVVTGATGQLGRLAVESLLRRGVPADEIVAVGRTVEKAADLAERGVTVRPAEYTDPESLRTAFAGADRLLFVSGSENGQRVPQHRGVVDAAVQAGVGLVAYTSIAHADTSDLILAREHAQTERMLIESGLPYAFLRNSWYLENYDLATALEHGLVGASGDGRISAATRADYAEAAAAVISGEGHEKAVYELGGEAFTMAELAAEISRQSGRDVGYTDLPQQRYLEVLVGGGRARGDGRRARRRRPWCGRGPTPRRGRRPRHAARPAGDTTGRGDPRRAAPVIRRAAPGTRPDGRRCAGANKPSPASSSRPPSIPDRDSCGLRETGTPLPGPPRPPSRAAAGVPPSWPGGLGRHGTVGSTGAEGTGATAPTGRGGQGRRDDPVVTDGGEDTATLLDAVLVARSVTQWEAPSTASVSSMNRGRTSSGGVGRRSTRTPGPIGSCTLDAGPMSVS